MEYSLLLPDFNLLLTTLAILLLVDEIVWSVVVWVSMLVLEMRMSSLLSETFVLRK